MKYKVYKAKFDINDNVQEIYICSTSLDKARQTAIDVYDNYVKTKLISNYEFVSIELTGF